MTLTLENLIKTQIAAHPSAGAEELAMYVAQATPVEDVKTFYARLLVSACRSAIGQHRATPNKPQSQPQGRPNPTPSPKLRERRNWWAEMLRNEMRLAGGVAKPLGDCTIDDLRYCIKERDQAIGRIEDQISNLKQLIILMSQHQARTVRELPEQQQWRPAS